MIGLKTYRTVGSGFFPENQHRPRCRGYIFQWIAMIKFTIGLAITEWELIEPQIQCFTGNGPKKLPTIVGHHAFFPVCPEDPRDIYVVHWFHQQIWVFRSQEAPPYSFQLIQLYMYTHEQNSCIVINQRNKTIPEYIYAQPISYTFVEEAIIAYMVQYPTS